MDGLIGGVAGLSLPAAAAASTPISDCPPPKSAASPPISDCPPSQSAASPPISAAAEPQQSEGDAASQRAPRSRGRRRRRRTGAAAEKPAAATAQPAASAPTSSHSAAASSSSSPRSTAPLAPAVIAAAKDAVRRRVWDFMEANNFVRDYPRPCHGKIPHFKGCQFASERLSRLREFRAATRVKINPSLAQMHLRFITLMQRKTLLVPDPALKDNFFYAIDGDALQGSASLCKRASSKAGAAELGAPIGLDEVDAAVARDDGSIDLVVVASVAVAENGVRLGKGLGYAELEWAILWELGAVDERTVVATTVHEAQIVACADLPPSLLAPHDLPVDVIVTPNRVVNVRMKLPKPSCGVLWDEVTDERLEAIPILKTLKTFRAQRL